MGKEVQWVAIRNNRSHSHHQESRSHQTLIPLERAAKEGKQRKCSSHR